MLKKVLLMSILLATMTSLGFSQTDTTKVSLPTPIVRLTIKDLIRGDGYKQEVRLLNEKVILMEQQEELYSKVIFEQNTQLNNFTKIISIKDEQIKEYLKITSNLETQLAKERLKSKLYKSLGFVVGGILVISLI